jgi:hypothetical protein
VREERGFCFRIQLNQSAGGYAHARCSLVWLVDQLARATRALSIGRGTGCPRSYIYLLYHHLSPPSGVIYWLKGVGMLVILQLTVLAQLRHPAGWLLGPPLERPALA